MLKQRFVLILFACLTVVGLVACGTSGTSGSASNGTPGSAKSSTPTVLVVYTFTHTGVLYPDHTFPGIAEVITSSPNQVNSSQVKPTGQCS